jgi:hypothetical protein
MGGENNLESAAENLRAIQRLIADTERHFRLASCKSTDVAAEWWSELDRGIDEMATLAANLLKMSRRTPPSEYQRRLPLVNYER